MKTLYDSYLSILWDGSLDRGLASTLIMIHGVCKRFWLNILQSKWGTHCSSDKIISHTLSKWKPFIVLGWKFSCKMGEHYKKRKRKLSLLKFSYQSICVTHYVLEAHILGSARCFCAIARSSFLHMQQQMPKYLVLSWSICQFACVGMLQSILANISTFHVLSLTKN